MLSRANNLNDDRIVSRQDARSTPPSLSLTRLALWRFVQPRRKLAVVRRRWTDADKSHLMRARIARRHYLTQASSSVAIHGWRYLILLEPRRSTENRTLRIITG